MRLSYILLLFLAACSSPEASVQTSPPVDIPALAPAPAPIGAPEPVDTLPPPPPPIDFDTTEWTEMTRLNPTIALDIRYATANNFMDTVIYDCGRCFYRKKVARSLDAVQRDLSKAGLGLKMYDCYRPAPYQQRLWDVLPDARYVARPSRGSLHSRGAAADLTLIHLDTGEELDMGTPYDFFGEAAYTTTTDLPDAVLQNRKTLQEAMRAHGFGTIRTEWWHFNYLGPRAALANWVWGCE